MPSLTIPNLILNLLFATFALKSLPLDLHWPTFRSILRYRHTPELPSEPRPARDEQGQRNIALPALAQSVLQLPR